MELNLFLGTYSWIIIPLGLFLGLLGYRLFRISLFIIGLCLGMTLGLWIAETTGNMNLGVILGIILGLALGVASNFLIRFSLFLAGMTAGVVTAAAALEYIPSVSPGLESTLWMLGAGLLAGLITLPLYKVLVLVMTSLLGTFLIYQGTVGYFPSNTSSWIWILYVVLLAVFIVVQASARKGHPDPVERARERRSRY